MTVTDNSPGQSQHNREPQQVMATNPPREPQQVVDVRRPPQDNAAEMSVLGSMLLSKDAIADVVEVIREDDFYTPAHQLVFGVIRDLFGRGEPADAVTVANALTRAGNLERIGGAVYLHTLVSGVPTAANAAYYATIVREQATLRRLVSAAQRITQWGYAGEDDVDQIVDRAQQEVFEVSSRRTAEDYLPLADIMDSAVSEIEGIAARGGEMVGVPTGFKDLDKLTNGFHAGQLIIVAARPAIGKALALDSAIPTPTGWTTMGEVAVGDHVLDINGSPTKVVRATEVMRNRTCYRVEFSDGSSLVADANHNWQTATGEVQTTGDLYETFDGPVPLPAAEPLHGAHWDTLTNAYDFGSKLARNWCEVDPGVDPAQLLTSQDSVDPISPHIPLRALRASTSQRRDLLAGILDYAGRIRTHGQVAVICRSRALVAGLFELLSTLTGNAQVSVQTSDVEAGLFELTFTDTNEIFRQADKALRHKEESVATDIPLKCIQSIAPVESVPVRCIEVASPDHLFLAGRSLIPTHNSTLGLDVARAASVQNGLTSVIFSLEMGRNEIVMRLLSAEAQIALQNMRSGKMNDPEWRKIASRQGVLHQAPLYIDDSPNLTMTEIRAKCRRLKQRNDLRLVIVDYMQLMQSGKRVESRQQEVSEFSRSMKLLAKELDVPVIAISQLNRGPEARNDKKPMLSDLRESGSLEQDADMVILIHREDAYDKTTERAGEADLIVAKHRNGPTDTVTVSFQGHYSRFVDMAHE